MAAGVVTHAGGCSGNANPYSHSHVVPYWATDELATTSLDDAGDDVLLFKFPAGAYIPNSPSGMFVSMDDVDTNATPTVVVDFGIGDSDGVIDTVLINDSTIGQGGGGASATPVTGGAAWLDVGDKYAIMTIVTGAATGAAGTVSVGGLIAYGVNELT